MLYINDLQRFLITEMRCRDVPQTGWLLPSNNLGVAEVVYRGFVSENGAQRAVEA
jgi:hypothetical protein